VEYWSGGVLGSAFGILFQIVIVLAFRQLRGKRVGESGVMAFSRH
jgi:hypothetical protein